MFEPVLNGSIIGRAQKSGVLEIVCHQLRDYAFDKHKRVDDTPYGGGMGMLMKAEPIALCFEDICKQIGKRPHFVYMSPQGKTLKQQRLRELADVENICILCGHYEGVDQRLLDEFIDEEISIGGRRNSRNGICGRTFKNGSGCAFQQRMFYRGKPF